MYSWKVQASEEADALLMLIRESPEMLVLQYSRPLGRYDAVAVCMSRTHRMVVIGVCTVPAVPATTT